MAFTLARALLLLLSVFALAHALDEGILPLDDTTFDKIVDGSRDVFVRFDKEYPYGDAHDAFKALAKQAAPSPLLVASVGISNRDTWKVNSALAERFGFAATKEEDFPFFRLFKKGAPVNQPIEFTGDAKAEPMLSWIVGQTGIFIGLKGQVRELDELAKELVAAKEADKKAVVAKAQEAANAVTGAAPEHIEYYVKTFQRVLEKGAAYPQAEAARLRKMAADKGVTAAKKETFTWRANILDSFITASAVRTEL